MQREAILNYNHPVNDIFAMDEVWWKKGSKIAYFVIHTACFRPLKRDTWSKISSDEVLNVRKDFLNEMLGIPDALHCRWLRIWAWATGVVIDACRMKSTLFRWANGHARRNPEWGIHAHWCNWLSHKAELSFTRCLLKRREGMAWQGPSKV